MKKKFTIEVEMDERWVDNFCSMLLNMEHLGNIDTSKLVGLYSDGSTDFKPTFKINTEFNKVVPYEVTDEMIQYDAGGIYTES